MARISGAFIGTENINQTNRPHDIDRVIYLENPDKNPMLTLLQNTDKKKKSDPKFFWMSRADRPEKTLVNNGGGYAAGATDIVVDDASIFIPTDTIRVYTAGAFKEQMRVTAVNTGTNTITVVRGVGSTAATALVDNDELIRMADAQVEFSSAPESTAEKLDDYYNYTQEIITTTRHSDRALNTSYYTEKEVITRRAETAENHKIKQELSFLLGERNIEGSGTSARTYSGGIDFWINQAVAAGHDVTQNQGAGTLTLTQWEQFLEEKGFFAGSDEKILLASPRLISVLNNLLRDKIRLKNMEDKYGINTQVYDSPHGMLHIVRHRLFKFGDLIYGGIIIDPNQVEMQYVGPSATQFRPNVGLQSDDGYVDKFKSDVGWKVILPQSCAKITNVQNAA